jgi:hypothetical protein
VRSALSLRVEKPHVHEKRLKQAEKNEARKSDEQEKKRKTSAHAKHGSQFAGKKFKDLTNQQKDKLLEACAVLLGLLDD